jgi:hypothetical protein
MNGQSDKLQEGSRDCGTCLNASFLHIHVTPQHSLLSTYSFTMTYTSIMFRDVIELPRTIYTYIRTLFIIFMYKVDILVGLELDNVLTESTNL